MYGILAGIIVSMSVGGYLYYKDAEATISELTSLNTAYELKHKEQEAALESLEKDFALQTQSLNELTARSQEIQQEMNRYLDIFKRHNLTKLAAAKPGLIETRVNKGTKDVFDSIESDSSGIDSLDDGLQLTTEGTNTGTDNNKTSGKKDSTASTTKSS